MTTRRCLALTRTPAAIRGGSARRLWSPIRPRRAVLWCGAVGMALGLVGCGGLEPVTTYQQITDPAQLFMTLAIDHSAATLSTAARYDTLQLAATPLNALGEPLTGLSAPTFHLATATDSTLVTVTSTGLLTAKAETTDPGVFVVAELQASGNIRRTDTMLVKVTTLAPPPVLTSFSIDPSDSAIRSMKLGTGFSWLLLNIVGLAPSPSVLPQALDAANAPITGLAIAYTSLDPDIAVVDRWQGTVNFLRPGQARLVARTTAYGVIKTATTAFTVTLPISQEFNVVTGQLLQQREFRIVPHGYVLFGWLNNDGDPVTMDLAFDTPPGEVATPPAVLCDAFEGFLGPGLCGTGDISFPLPATPGQQFQAFRMRQFPVPGIYPYHTSTGETGRIIVE